MTNEVKIGIDVDSTDVKKASDDLEKMNVRLRDSKGRFVAAGKGADAFTRALQEETTQIGKMKVALGGAGGLINQVRGLFTAFVAQRAIRDLQQVAGELQGVNLAFQAITGSMEGANRELEYASELADRFGSDLRVVEDTWKQTLGAASATGAAIGDVRKLFEGVTALGTVTGLTADATRGSLTAISQILSKGTVQAEELRGQLAERMPQAIGLLQQGLRDMVNNDLNEFLSYFESLGPAAQKVANEIVRTGDVTSQQLNKLMEQGALSADLFTKAFGRATQQYADMAEAAGTAAQAQNDLGNRFLRLKRTVVESGFLEALGTVLELLEKIAANKAAEDMARALGQAFKFLSENLFVVVGLVGALGVLIAGPYVAAIAAAVAGLALLSQQTFELGDKTVDMGEVFSTVWKGIKMVMDSALLVSGEVLSFFRTLGDATIDWGGESVRVTDAVIGAFEDVWDTFNDVVSLLADLFTKSSDAGDGFEDLGGIGKKAADLILEGWQAMASAVELIFVRIPAHMEIMIAQLLIAWNDFKIKFYDNFSDLFSDARGMIADVVEDSEIYVQRIIAANKRLDNLKITADETGNAIEDVTNLSVPFGAQFSQLPGDLRDAKKEIEDLPPEINEVTKATGRLNEETERARDIWDEIGASVAGAAVSMGRGTGGVAGALGGILNSVTSGFEKTLSEAASKMGESLADTLRGAAGTGGLFDAFDPVAIAGVGSGIATAITGGLEGNTQSIGAGIGQAAGAAIGFALGGPVGSIIGGTLGSLAGGLLGGNRKSQEDFGYTVFAGTPFASQQSTRAREDKHVAGRLAMQGFRDAFQRFDDIVNEYTRNLGENVAQMNTHVGAAQQASQKFVDVIGHNIGKGPEVAKQQAEAYEAALNEVFNLAVQVATAGATPLTQAQQAWRAFNDQFTKDNVELLRKVGFSAQQIAKAREETRKKIATGFEEDLLEVLQSTESLTSGYADKLLRIQLDRLAIEEKAAISTAKEIGSSTELVRAAFRAQRDKLLTEFEDLQASILETQLEGMYAQRDEIEAELSRRLSLYDQAESAIEGVLKSFVGSELAPGSPANRIDALQAEFNAAVTAAQGGDAEAGTDAARLAQELLSTGRDFYGSSRDFSELFRAVNSDLMAAQEAISETSDRIEDSLTNETFEDITRQSTEALLKALAALKDELSEIRAGQEAQTEEQAKATTGAKVA